MFKSLRYLSQAIDFFQLPNEMRSIIFYSESKNYWPLFKGLIDGLIDESELTVCYITSADDDPGFKYYRNRYKSFLIGDGYIRNWFFLNMQAKIVVMTMPDLHQYQVKRSKYNIHYIYLQHALVSLHMVYRNGAFDWYDTIFCAGSHHVREVRYIEEKYSLPKKKILKHGYARLDSIFKNNQIKKKIDSNIKHALFAPTWGRQGTIETGLGEKVVNKLLSLGYKVTLRIHPETRKSSMTMVNKIVSGQLNNNMFIFEDNVVSLDSFFESDFMVSDWSGAALEYSFGLNKPVVFLDVPRKNNNPKYKEINITPLEVSIREKIGVVATLDDIDCSLIDSLSNISIDSSRYVFNIGKSDFYGIKYILDLLEKIDQKNIT
jgi:CDP-glycerol glycerophosphotransferase (TagB/SpsB family)